MRMHIRNLCNVGAASLGYTEPMQSLRIDALFVLALWWVVAPARAAAAAEPEPRICSDPEFRQFDFWVGNWTVQDESRQFAGDNRITLEQRGCVVVEHWSSARGGTGQSLNYYDPVARAWKQRWVGLGLILEMQGRFDHGAMVLEGPLYYVREKRTSRLRGTWSALPDGRVRQLFVESADGGKTWAPWFDGYYSRRDGEPATAATRTCEDSAQAVASAPRLLIDADNRRDLDGVLAGYTRDAVWLPPEGPALRGRENLQSRYRQLFSRNDPRLSADIAEAHASDGWGYAWGTIRGTVSPRDGGAPAQVADHFLAITRCEEQRWKVSHLIWNHGPT